jgi:hypothetical protein
MVNQTSNTIDILNVWYRSIHGYSSLTVCILGVVLNFFNIIVLTRKHMRSSTNVILIALALSDFLIKFIYIPTSFRFYLLNKNEEYNAFWTTYAIVFVSVTVTFHSISIWLTVFLAFFRYIYVCRNKIGKRLCTRRNAIKGSIITSIISIVFCTPSYFLSKIIQINNSTIYYEIVQSDVDRYTNGLIFRITFIIQAFLIKLIPCLLLITLSGLLIHSIHKSNKNKSLKILSRRRMTISEKSRDHSRTNTILVIVCILFFITEFPQGIIALLSIIYESSNFHQNIYMKLGDLMDIISLINNSINFFLYCFMNPIFRKTFKNIIFLTNETYELKLV